MRDLNSGLCCCLDCDNRCQVGTRSIGRQRVPQPGAPSRVAFNNLTCLGMIGLPHQAAANESSTPSSSIVMMEGREGRIGNAFACERCRKHKVRCVPSETAGICQRCLKARVECIEHIARRRPAKLRTAQTRTQVGEMETKLEKLSAIVTTTSGPSCAHQATLPSVKPVPSQITDVHERTSTPAPTTVQSTASTAKPSALLNPASTPESALSFWQSINETLSGLGRLDPVIRSIGMPHMQLLLDSYQNMVPFFPFVPLPKGSFCRDLIQQRPIFMFAVLTVASYDSALLQLTLSREFRKFVMMKIMNGEKSLDLLQGLLVFTAWHHHYMDSQAISVHMLLQICLGLAGDLGLENLSSSPKSPLQKEGSHDIEAKRAYLGCYHLAANLGLLDSYRSRSISYSNTLRNYASDLASTWEHRSDAVLPILVDICQFMEDVEETFRNRSEQALIARSQVKRLNNKWDNIRLASKAQAHDYKTLQWIQLAAQMYLYRVATTLELPDRESISWASGFQLSLRISCLRSIEQFLDSTLQLAPNQYEFLSIIDWLSMVSALVTLSRLAVDSPMSGWDPSELQVDKTFDYFRDRLSSQMPRPRDPQESNEDLFERFRRVAATMMVAIRNTPGRASPNNSTFEIATGSGRTVSLLQDLPPLKPNGVINEAVKAHPRLDMNDNDFLWKFLMGTV